MNAVANVVPLRLAPTGIATEADGPHALIVVRRPDAMRLMRDADQGDRQALLTMMAVNALLGSIGQPSVSPKRCAGCNDPLRAGRYNFLVALPADVERQAAVAVGVCIGCAGNDRKRIVTKGLAGLRLRWPDLRELVVTHPQGGRG